MAYSTSLGKKKLDTLPADFNEWDAGDKPATLPDDFSGFDSEPHIDPIPSPVERPARASSRVSNPGGRAANSSSGGADYRGFSPVTQIDRDDSEDLEAESGSQKKKLVIIIASASVVLLLLVVFAFTRHRSTPAVEKQEVVIQEPRQVETPTSDSAPVSKPSPATSAAIPASVPAPATPAPHVQADAMKAQLSAPTRISRDLTKPNEQEAPGMSVAALEGMGGNQGQIMGTALGGKRTHVVGADPQIVNVSAGVAAGHLVRQTPPVYPPIARAARVSGTVVLGATISKSGATQDIRVISGPTMLRQAAVEALRGWRYRPYLLNNAPVDISTTVSVIFALNR
jgi:protein TonB